MISTTFYKTACVFLIWLIALPSASEAVQICMSLLFGFYVLSMIYFNIVKQHFNGKWIAYFKAMNFFKNK